MKKYKGIFISFEGPEASGKSSQIILLKKFLKEKKIPFVVTREPGGTTIGENLRKIILNKKDNISNLEEILLLMSARLNHINNVILPALNKGKIVISDRYADSTFVYQGYVNGYGIKEVQYLHKKLLNNFLPNKTFLFFLPPKDIINRLKKRNIKNKYDKKNLHFHKKVITGYNRISKNKNRFIDINANQNKMIIHKFILKKLGYMYE
tara:strand:- start:1379 stop:2002 length:624 start_codon:yes stop_codon:yes gene_type:complete